MAIQKFAGARAPGIYKQDYFEEFFGLYGDPDGAPEAPQRPAWCLGWCLFDSFIDLLYMNFF